MTPPTQDIYDIYEQAAKLIAEANHSQAIPLLEQVVEACPAERNARQALIASCIATSNWKRAAEAMSYMLAAWPHEPSNHANAGQIYERLGDFDRAHWHYNRAIEIDPHYAVARWNRAFFQLKRLEQQPELWKSAWSDYEWGTCGPLAGVPGRPRRSMQAQWDGRPIPGKTLYICDEQGAGDSIFFARWMKTVKEVSQAQVVWEVKAFQNSNLLRLLEKTAQDAGVILVAVQDLNMFACAFDEYAMNASIPSILSECCDFHNRTYLHPFPQLDIDLSKPLKVGFCWNGNPNFAANGQRSMTWELIEPMATLDGIEAVNLLFGDEHITPVLDGDFYDTAKRIHECDFIVTTDTSVANIAGAMGMPGIVMLANDADWRWGLADRTPWYPSLQLIRQEKQGEWGAVVESTIRQLKAMADFRAS